jgi:prepilin-type N-terminal cleavage/methylation domain-containing protein/prepilin-type processing-associated H-X9-DG protein
MNRSTRRGLTLVEVLIVIAILVVLIFLCLPMRRNVREAANRMTCMNNLKKIILAIHTQASMGNADSAPSKGAPESREEFLPTGCVGPGKVPEDRLSWMVTILPYLEADSVYQTVQRDKGADSVYQTFQLNKGFDENLEASRARMKCYVCPSSPGDDKNDLNTPYIAMAGIGLGAPSQPTGTPGNGFMGYDRLTTLGMIKDGISNTLAIMETRSNMGPWAQGGPSNLRGFEPTDLPFFGEKRPFGGHTPGMNAAWADGSVRFLSSKADPKTLAAIITIDGGESVDHEQLDR